MLIPHDRLLANYTFEDLLTPLKSFSHVQHQREAMDYTNLHVDIYQANTYFIISRIKAIYIYCAASSCLDDPLLIKFSGW
jgi:hypothetical protein